MRKGSSKNTLEQIDNNIYIYMGLDKGFMRNNHITCILKGPLLITLLYT